MKIHEKSLIVSLHIGLWGASKLDRPVTNETLATKHAVRGAGRFFKYLIPRDTASYREVAKAASTLRSLFRTQTLAWADDGSRLLPTANYWRFNVAISAAKTVLEAAVTTFLADYPALLSQSQDALGDLHNPAEYPSVDTLREKFYISMTYNPLPDSADFRISLGDEEKREIVESCNAAFATSMAAAKADMSQRLQTTLERIISTLHNPTTIFRDSLIENARELGELLKYLNVDGDPGVESIRARLAALVVTDPKILRTDSTQRQSTADEASRILADMTAIFGAPHAQ